MSRFLYRRIRVQYRLVGPLIALLVAVTASSGLSQRVISDDTTVSRASSLKAQQSPLDRRIDLNLTNTRLSEVVRAISAASGIKITYASGLWKHDPLVSIQAKQESLQTIFSRVLAGTHIDVVVIEGRLALIEQARPSVTTAKEAGNIEGRVIDSSTKNPLAGATVMIDGTNTTSITDKDGRFFFSDIPVGQKTIVVRLVGYRSGRTVVEVSAKSVVRATISLTVSSAMLSEVVTTASGKQRRLEVGNDIVVINVDSVIRDAPVRSVTDLLQTRVPGLTVQRSSGSPGDPSRIRIRGVGSITRSNEPVVIVDGIRINASEQFNKDPGDNTNHTFATASLIDQIDLNSIETIEVQKGPSASALYGSDAANGVIVITTKRGQAGPTRWALTFNQGIQMLPGNYAERYYSFSNGMIGTPTTLCGPDPVTACFDSIVPFQALNHPRLSPIGRGHESRMSSTVSGGTNRLSYSTTASMSNTHGYLKLPAIERERFEKFRDMKLPSWAVSPDQYKDWQFSSNLTITPSDNLRLTVSNVLSQSQQQKSSLGQWAVSELSMIYIDTTQLGYESIFGGRRNIYRRDRSNTLSIRMSASADWQPLSWLPLTGNVGIDAVARNTEQLTPRGFAPEGSQFDQNLGLYSSGRGDAVTHSVAIGIGGQGLTLPLRNGRQIRLLSGINLTRVQSSTQTATADSLISGVTFPSTLNEGRQQLQSNRTAGWFVEPKLDLQSRFFVVPGFRLDASGVSGRNAALKGFPKMNVSWIASEESFFPQSIPIELLRLRVAYGYAGRLPHAGEGMRLFGLETISPNTQVFEPLKITSIGNTRLRPERTGEGEVGIDLELFKNRINTSITYSFAHTTDAIVNAVIPPSVFGGMFVSNSSETGYPVNIGNVRKYNLEMSLFAQLIDRRSLGWNITTSFTRGTNKITRLTNDGEDMVAVGATSYRLGYPIGSVWVRPVVWYADVNGNGAIDNTNELMVSDSLSYVGAPYPQLSTNVSTALTLFQGRVRASGTVSYTNGMTQILENSGSGNAFMGGGCTYCGPDHPAYIPLATQANIVAKVTPQVVDVLRFQELSVSYVLPQRLVSSLRLERASVALQGTNLGMHTNYRGKDPDVNGRTKVETGERLSDSGQLPMPKTWRLNVQVGL